MRNIITVLLIAMLFANNAAASSENAPACGKLSDYYTQKIMTELSDILVMR